MSYILDALRRAEAQRERGAVPGVHAQSHAALPLGPEPRRSQRALWLIGAAVLVLLAALAWFFFLRGAPREAVAPVLTAQAPAVIVLAPPVPAPVAVPVMPAAPPPVPTPAPAAAAAPQSSSLDAKAAARAARESARAEAKAARAAAAQARPASAAVKPGATAAPASSAAALPAAAPPRLYTRDELPGDIRGQLPAVNVTGSAYSENAAHRMLIANGQVFHENEKITADLTVEQIGPKAAVLNFRGYRYTVAY